ncbi:hypothetical protein Z517_09164 [Fonsecaea pedrosoi CBS 271.37]|uniref:Protein kinase domain-containing protein n=1 Tax=Fonsecaea pedrosoi CBS 271.37 TaxID=1442368 RepID=A0A0D2GDF1_9EURO|nr:uncharacterized protein Z517_09164 [Fonsecaea pedrosoi CBS 271.37]KIW76720.1 hypothetical protein Z517_09164 [Fonsecaea pedrosoi CBS 271.37]
MSSICYNTQRNASSLEVMLLEKENEILHIAAQCLNVNVSACKLSDVADWNHCSFNLRVPIHVDWKGLERVLFRVPLPYKIGEDLLPGNMDEKVRCEAAIYIYIHQHCPDVPIPMLLGFGVSTGIDFTPLENASFLCLLYRWLADQLRTVVGIPLASPFVANRRTSTLCVGYIVLEYIERGQMLSETFNSQICDPSRRWDQFKDLSRIMGYISLSKRPLTLQLQALENEDIPTGNDRLRTYECTESYVLDLLAYRDSRLLHQPNSMNDEKDGRRQMSAVGLTRSIMPLVHQPQDRTRPGFPRSHGSATVQQSNIFVNEWWQVENLIGLEWACSHPSEMLRPPYLLTGEKVDCLYGKTQLDRFCNAREEFMAEFRQQEMLLTSPSETTRSAMTDQIAAGLQYLHSKGVVHADVGWQNVIVVNEDTSDQDSCRLIDSEGCGVDGNAANSCYEWFSYRLATPRVSEQTDIFACGCLVYELVTDTPLYRDEYKDSRHRDHEVEQLYLANRFPDLANWPLRRVIHDCWHGHFNTMADMIQALNE